MPVNNNYEIQEYKGNSCGRIYNFPFRCFSLDHLKVELVDSKGSVTELIQNTDYKVTGGLDNSGGMITYPLDVSLPALSSSETIRIYRSTPMEQSIDYPTYQQAIENALDKVTMLLQEAVNDSAVNIANEAIEKVNQILTLAISKTNVDGSNIDKYPFLNALGIGSDGELDLTDFCKTDGSNADVVAFRTLVGMQDVESDINKVNNDLSGLAKTDGSNIQVDQWQNLLGINAAIAPQTIVKGAVGEIPNGWQEGWCDKPAEHLYWGNSPVKGYKGLLPPFTSNKMEGWGEISANAYYDVNYAWNAFDNSPTSYHWNSNSGSNHTLTYTGTFAKGMIEAYSITARHFSGNENDDITVAPKSWSLVDSDGNIIDTQANVSDWTSGETKVFALSSPLNTKDLQGLKFININNNGYPNGYTCIGNISFLESINNDAEITVRKGLQVAAGVEGKVLLSDELESDTSLNISSALAQTNGTFYTYADLDTAGNMIFGFTEDKPKVNNYKTELATYKNTFPTMSSNITPNLCWATSQDGSAYAPYLAFDGVLSSSSLNSWVSLKSVAAPHLIARSSLGKTLGLFKVTAGRTSSPRNYPIDFEIVYTNDEINDSGGCVSNLLTKYNWITATSVLNQVFTTDETKTYYATVPSSATAFGLKINRHNKTTYNYVSISEFEAFERIVTDESSDYYNTSTHTHYDKDDNIIKRVYLGEFEVTDGVVTHVVNYQHGTTVTLPVNGGANIGINTTYYEDLPYLGECASQAKIYHENKWGKTGWIYNSSNNGGHGTKAHINKNTLTVVTGNLVVTSTRPISGSAFKTSTSFAPAKVTVNRLW